MNLPDESKNRARLMNSPVAATGTVSNVSRTKIGLQFLLVSSVIVVLFSKVVVSIVVEVLSSIVEISVLVVSSVRVTFVVGESSLVVEVSSGVVIGSLILDVI